MSCGSHRKSSSNWMSLSKRHRIGELREPETDMSPFFHSLLIITHHIIPPVVVLSAGGGNGQDSVKKALGNESVSRARVMSKYYHRYVA